MKKVNLLLLVIVLILCGCSYKADYTAGYVYEHIANISPTIDGKALIYTEIKEDEKVYSQKPSSLTGGASTLNIKVGEILKNIALEVFSKKFKDGAYHSNSLQHLENYAIVIQPEILNYDYRYNSLKNLGFAITPEAKIDLRVFLYDNQGKLISEKKYESEYLSGGSYMVNFSPHEKVNKAVHEILYNLLIKVSDDVENTLLGSTKK